MRSDATERAAVLGAGSWGTALAIHLGNEGHDVSLWGRDPALIDEMASRRVNPTYLPDVRFPSPLRLATSLEDALDGACYVIVAVPSHGLRAVVRAAAPLIPRNAILVSATKGFETDTLQRMSEVDRRGDAAARHPVVVLSGPSFAAEVARQSADGARRRVDRSRRGAGRAARVPRTVRSALYGSDDVVGVEVGAALKNIDRDRRGRRRVAASRPQRAVGADHARPRGDLAAGVRDGRPPRDARRAERPRRSRAHLHGDRSAGTATSGSSSAGAGRSTRFFRARRWSPKACARRRRRSRWARVISVELPIAAQMAEVLAGRRRRATRSAHLMLRPQRDEADVQAV